MLKELLELEAGAMPGESVDHPRTSSLDGEPAPEGSRSTQGPGLPQLSLSWLSQLGLAQLSRG